ncbi:MAG: hypothetical protein H6Q21_1518 [Bacteroidetes bacterium]|nr:hypothetical protein [Bacteroidota bacterium]
MMQKIQALIGFFLLFCPAAFSQREPVSLINSQKEIDRSFFMAPELKYTKVNGDWETFAGMRMGYCINHTYVFGLGADGIISDNGFEGTGSVSDNDYLRNAMVYGGFYFDFIVPTGIPLQVSFPTLLGIGGDFVYEKQPYITILEAGDFLFAEPKINLELNLSRVIHIGAGVGYRFVINSHIQRLSNKDLSGVVINFTIKLGSF